MSSRFRFQSPGPPTDPHALGEFRNNEDMEQYQQLLTMFDRRHPFGARPSQPVDGLWQNPVHVRYSQHPRSSAPIEPQFPTNRLRSWSDKFIETEPVPDSPQSPVADGRDSTLPSRNTVRPAAPAYIGRPRQIPWSKPPCTFRRPHDSPNGTPSATFLLSTYSTRTVYDGEITNISEFDVFVGNLDPSVSAANLASWFEPFANVLHARIICDHNTGQSKGFGFVTFSSMASVSQAVSALHGTERAGKTIRVEESMPKLRN